METSKSLKLQSLQNRAARAVTQSSYDADTSQLIKKLGWDNLENRRQNLKAEMVYKSLNSLTPSYLSSKFIQRSDMVTKKKNSYSDAVLWNSLPQAVRQAKSLTNFQRSFINCDTAFMKNRL